ncbi:MAG: DUF5302 domain-containing protein [Actinomycetes bacterium]
MTESEQQSDALTAKEEEKRKFREALDRKQGKHADPLAHNPTVAHPHTGPAKPQRTFRRKSG